VTKYRHNPDAVKTAEKEQTKAEQEAAAIAEAAKKLADEAKAAPIEKRAEADNAAKTAAEKLKAADAMKTEATRRMKAATDAAAPKDTADIVVSEPIRILVKPADTK
jgi:regulator of protease activity HflC (stomatin/prohibitin superfamily)